MRSYTRRSKEQCVLEEEHSREEGAEELLRRALVDDSSAVSVSLRVSGLPLSEALTVIFHGRRDLGTLQTYVTWGARRAGATVAARDLLRRSEEHTSELQSL